MAVGPHKITEEFEEKIAQYTGAPYVACVDNCSNALFLALRYLNYQGEIIIPSNTYPSVPCEIILSGAKVKFEKGEARGAYQLKPTKVYDSALRFSHDMYIPGSFMCVSFTGAYKHLKLGKGGAILTDDYQAWLWFKRARNSGRRECSYHEDNFDMLGYNFYMMPEIAARGLLLIQQFYDMNGQPVKTKDVEVKYPDLSKYKIYENR
jgi:dTDP-4-amino-4,6-dideoxygalactose transaminase